MNRWVINGLVGLLTILAGSTAYYASKTTVLQRQLGRKNAVPSATTSQKEVPTGSPSNRAISSPSVTSTTTTARQLDVPTLKVADHITTAAETYTVVSGDTLYPIGLKYNLAWQRIAETNGLAEPFTLTIGQVLMIPTVDVKTSVYELRFSTDIEKATTAQTNANSGQDTWRLDPVLSAEAELSSAFGLTTADDYRLVSRDDQAGLAQVLATRLVDNQTYSYAISLIQPVTKGKLGIWALEKIQPKL